MTALISPLHSAQLGWALALRVSIGWRALRMVLRQIAGISVRRLLVRALRPPRPLRDSELSERYYNSSHKCPVKYILKTKMKMTREWTSWQDCVWIVNGEHGSVGQPTCRSRQAAMSTSRHRSPTSDSQYHSGVALVP